MVPLPTEEVSWDSRIGCSAAGWRRSRRNTSESACWPAFRCSGSTRWPRRLTDRRPALTLLIALGAGGIRYIGPITTLIIVLLLVVYFSYRQTIAAYPLGGGSYTVAKENLGTAAGLVAAAALMLDYVLVVAVGVSAGIGALVSALPVFSRTPSGSAWRRWLSSPS